MIQICKVISSDREQALIQVVRKSACGGNCDKCGSSCSMGYLISVPNTVDAKLGELVDIEYYLLKSNKKELSIFYDNSSKYTSYKSCFFKINVANRC